MVIIGFGNQAKAWALNLKDSGYNIEVALRENSKSISLARELGFAVISLEEIKDNSMCAVLTPDDTHKKIVQNYRFPLR